MNEAYVRQVELLLSVLPTVMKEDCFAIKGGTAINFFWQDLPRLSVDIDLVYLPLTDRNSTLVGIDTSLMRIKQEIVRINPSAEFIEKRITGGTCITLTVKANNTAVKIEPNTVLRGSVFPVCERDISPAIEKQLNISSFVTIKSLDSAELYGGKIVAALDRQHPRDLFDVRKLFEQGGITEKIRTAFVIYLCGHNRPMHEVLKPKPNDLEPAFSSEFNGMVSIPVSIDALQDTRQQLFEMIPGLLSDNEKQFLISLKKGEPDWSLIPVDNIDQFPSIQWKLSNIKKLDKKKHLEQLKKLEAVLERR
jgi:predicted nucleotidyltransferase component of viral defense system